MDLLDWLLGHDAWTTRQLLLRAAPLADEQLDRPFDIDERSLRDCFVHIIENMEDWGDLLRGADPRAPAPERTGETIADLLRRHAAASRAFAGVARTVAREARYGELWTDTLDNPPTLKSYGGTIAHLITHSMHHRAQAMYMLEQLGCRDHVEGDVLSWEAQAFGWADPPPGAA
ncbi:MAG TPA: DinB family protein [Herpetosiphonaceae bacterium]